MTNPLNIGKQTKTGLVEQIMRLRGASMPHPREHRTMLENLRMDQLVTVRDSLLAQIAALTAEEVKENPLT